ncbi:MAG: SusC/RagA family TonB-linked outer membrane protein [Muribaculum sp.]|nr:SusC/RagA family TonB-linked outer membrane protein [Muribaculaceae bacterium]MCM1080724.1 SusC/RagA family TonB-linked outer membrane protein [Muribaculum sp.]
MIDIKVIFPILLASAVVAMPMRSSAAEPVPTEAQAILNDTVAYGDQLMELPFGYSSTRDAYVGAQSSVDATQIEKWKGASLMEAIKGKLAGYNGGVIRGLSSYTVDVTKNGAPLVVLDGIPMPLFGVTDIMDPAAIEEVVLLKDASAKALYGPMAASGVLLITTKKGIQEGVKVDVTANVGLGHPTKLHEMFGSYDQALLRNQALMNDGLDPKFSAAQLAAFQDGTGANSNWVDLYKKDRFSQKYNVQVRGGGNKARFYMNAGFVRETGDIETDYDKKYDPSFWNNRFTVNSNLDVDVFSFLRVFSNTNVIINRVNVPRTGADGNGSTAELYKQLYTTPAYIEDGLTESGAVKTYEGYPRPLYGEANLRGINTSTQTTLNTNIGLDLDMSFLTKGLSFKTIFGYSAAFNGVRAGSADYERAVFNETSGEWERYGTNVVAPLTFSKSSFASYYLNYQAMFNYKRTFGDHLVQAFVNYQAEDYRGEWTTPEWILPTSRLQLGGEVKYGFKDRYFIQFDFTEAGSEMMRKGRQFHFSPTYGASWVASNESWFQNNIMTYLKVRASYGRLKYDSLKNQSSRYLYSTTIREMGAGLAAIFDGFTVLDYLRGNPSINWEDSEQQNYGIDLGFWDKLHISVDYWRENQKGIVLANERLPFIAGTTESYRPYGNYGKMENQGIDLSAQYSTILPCGLEITARGTFGWNKNKITDGADVYYDGYAYPYRKTGYTLGQEFGYIVDRSNGNGYYNTQEEIDNSGLIYTGVQPRLGDFRYKDLNDDGVIDEADKAPLKGTKLLPSVNYGVSVTLAYKGFDLYLEGYGEGGRSKLMNATLGVAENQGDGVYMPIHKQAWTAERYANHERIAYPALSTTASSSLEANDYFVSKLDYLRLRNATIGYTLPYKLTKNWGMSRVRVYVNGTNLLTWDNMKFGGMDPEVACLGSFVNRTVNFGLNINF